MKGTMSDGVLNEMVKKTKKLDNCPSKNVGIMCGPESVGSSIIITGRISELNYTSSLAVSNGLVYFILAESADSGSICFINDGRKRNRGRRKRPDKVIVRETKSPDSIPDLLDDIQIPLGEQETISGEFPAFSHHIIYLFLLLMHI